MEKIIPTNSHLDAYAGFSSGEGTCEPVLIDNREKNLGCYNHEDIYTVVSPLAATSIESEPFNRNECIMARLLLFATTLTEGGGITAFISGPIAAIGEKNPKWIGVGALGLFLSKAIIHGYTGWGLHPLSTLAAVENVREKCGPPKAKLRQKAGEYVKPAPLPALEPIPSRHFRIRDDVVIKPETIVPAAGLTLGMLFLFRLSPSLALANSFIAAPLQSFADPQIPEIF